jgi:adenylosuccinate synthase
MMKGPVATVVACLLLAAVSNDAVVYAAETESGGDASFSEKVGAAAKKIGKKIEDGFKKTAKKIEDKNVPEKVEKKLKKAVDKTAEGFEKAERKIKKKLAE